MADRTVKVSLVLAAQGFMSGMDAAAQKTAQTGSELDKLNQKRQAFSQLGASAIGFGAAAAAGVGIAISRFADFDQQMSYVQASTHETAANMNLLRDAAIDAGARTVFSASEAAGAIDELAKAGVSTKDILSGGLDAALDLAAAGGLGVADAAGIAATALKTFNLEGEDMSHVADLLAAGAGKAMGDVSELAQALAQGGLVAKSTGLSIEETTAGLAAFAAQGLRGSDAGTSFKSMLQRLTPQSAEAQREMDRLGISAYDAQGQFIGLSEFAGNLQQSLKDLTPEQRNAALATIFGADAVRAANVLYEQGAKGIEEWTDRVNDQGYAAETAAIRLDNLKGDVEALGGAIDSTLIESGSGANQVLRDIVQTVTGVVGMFSDLPTPVLQAGLAFGVAAAAVGLVGGAALLATPRVAEFRAITSAAGISLKGLSLAAVGVTAGLTALIAVVAIVAQAQADMRAGAAEFADTLDDQTGALTKNSRALIAKKLADSGAYDGAKQAGIGQKELTDALYQGGDALDSVLKRMNDYNNANPFNVAVGNSINEVREMGVQLEDAAARHDDLKAASQGSAEASGDVAEGFAEVQSAAEGAQSDVDALADSIRGFGSAQFDVERATIGFNQAVADLDAVLKDGAGSLDVTTEAGRNTLSAMVDAASSTNEYAASVAAMGGSTEQVQGILDAGRQKIVDTRIALGDSEEAARLYADQLIATPSAIATQVALNGLDEAERALERITRERQVNIQANVVGGSVADRADRAANNAMGNLYVRGKVKEFRAGGFASGIYPATPGGIHRFAEAGHDEAYITMDPQYRNRSLDIWSDVGRRIGAWQQAPVGSASTPGRAGPTIGSLIVQAAPGMDENALADKVIRKIERKLG